jgi:hypothetical protein
VYGFIFFLQKQRLNGFNNYFILQSKPIPMLGNNFIIPVLLLFSSFFIACDSMGNKEKKLLDSFNKSLSQNIAITDSYMNQILISMRMAVEEDTTLIPLYNLALTVPELIAPINSFVTKSTAYLHKNNTLADVHNYMFKEANAERLADFMNQAHSDFFKILDSLMIISKEKIISGIHFEENDLRKIRDTLSLRECDESWGSRIFKDLSSKACIVQLQQSQADANNAAWQIIDFIWKNFSKKVFAYDKFEVFSSPSNSSIPWREPYETEIGLGTYTSHADFSVSVDGKTLPIKDGKAKYTTRPKNMGIESYMATISLKNPITGKMDTIKKLFQYGSTLSLYGLIVIENMDVAYIGVDNPLLIAANISSANVMVKVSGAGAGTLEKISNGHYMLHVKTLTKKDEFCYVEIWDWSKPNKIASYPFRVKPIPNPIAQLSNGKLGGTIDSQEMRLQKELIAELANFPHNVKCYIQSFKLYHVPSEGKSIEIHNEGAAFSAQSIKAIQAAKPGTSYQFMDVKGKCPGDTTPRLLNSLAFQVR